MGLVGYSDSEESSDEGPKALQKPIARPAPAKPAFQKVIDRANPHKIRVNLPERSRTDTSEDLDSEGPPAKKARIGGGGGLGGFNAILPAPKRVIVTATSGGSGKGLGSGISLKTGSAPGFSREPFPATEGHMGEDGDDREPSNGDGGKDTNNDSEYHNLEPTRPEAPKEPQKVGNPMMFKPLSVARKAPKKKKMISAAALPQALPPTITNESVSEPKAKPKVSLFSVGATDGFDVPTTGQSREYEPLIHHAKPNATDTIPSTGTIEVSERAPLPPPSQATDPSSTHQSLSSIATDLNLSPSARRQLFGRHGANASAINVVNFNTEAEYKANEELRAAGEQQAHNPVRAIAPGKHSLKQLVNAVSSQKDALEEQFASGRRNKKEAGSKYGW